MFALLLVSGGVFALKSGDEASAAFQAGEAGDVLSVTDISDLEFVDIGEVDVNLVDRDSEFSIDQDLNQDPPGDTLETMDFESEEFPPTGWLLVDTKNQSVGDEMEFAWTRQSGCEQVENFGAVNAAWVSGGGTAGSNLNCGDDIGAASAPAMINQQFDLSAYPGGLTVDYQVMVDLPVGSEAVRVCAAEASAQRLPCFNLNIAADIPQKRWLGLSNPIHFDDIGGEPAVAVYFLFGDGDETIAHDHFGAFFDDIEIRGLTESVGPTSPPATRAPTRTPTRTPTDLPPTATNTPPGPSKIAFLPMLLAKEDIENVPAPVTKAVSVVFGTELGSDNRVVDPGTKFEFGTKTLCAQISWFGYPDGTKISWQWFYRTGQSFTKLNGLMNDEVETQEEDHASRCIRAGEGDPVPINEYKVEAYINGASIPVAQNIGEVIDGVPEGATPRPPTPEPGATIAPSATPPGGGSSDCTQVVENGGFERGPDVAWNLLTNLNQGIERVVVENTSAYRGEWLAQLGGLAEARDQLLSGYFDLVDSSEIISATITFGVAIQSDETKDGTNDDILGVALLSQDGEAAALQLGVSEETLPEFEAWYTQTDPFDVTRELTKRNGWDRAQVLFDSINDAEDRSFHFVDEVQLMVCTNPDPLAAELARERWLRSPEGIRAQNFTLSPMDRDLDGIRNLEESGLRIQD